MKKFIAILISVLTAVPVFSREDRLVQMDGGFLRQLQKRDSVLVADQLEWGARLESVAEGTQFMLPDLSKGVLPEGVETVGGWTIDTLATRKERGTKIMLSDMEFKTRITSFDEGSYELPPLAMLRVLPGGERDTLLFDPQILEVKTMPVDTATFVVHDIKGQINYPVTFKELLPWIGGGLALAALICLGIWLLRRYRSKEEEARQKDPAHIVALREIDRWRSSKYWVPEKQKAFYSGVTDALRGYISAQWGVGAMEMTTAEIFDGLKDKDLTPELYQGAKELFERSDFVKFAKYTATDEDNAGVVPFAVRFVTETYQAMLEKEEEGQDVL